MAMCAALVDELLEGIFLDNSYHKPQLHSHEVDPILGLQYFTSLKQDAFRGGTPYYASWGR